MRITYIIRELVYGRYYIEDSKNFSSIVFATQYLDINAAEMAISNIFFHNLSKHVEIVKHYTSLI